jgi:hypothetical protein
MITYSILENILDEDEAAMGAFPTAAFWVQLTTMLSYPSGR